MVRLNGLDLGATYLLENPETGECREQTGRSLADSGVALAAAPRGGTIWYYQRQR